MGIALENLPQWLRPRRRLSRQLAVALGYEPGAGRSPEVIAKGTGQTAQHILDTAREHGIPIHEDADLAEVLARLDLGSQIPQELYEVIAELLAFIYRMNSGFARSD